MKAIFKLIRWKNLLLTALVVWLMEKMVAVPLLDRALFGEQLPSWLLCLLMLSVVMIAAGGYAINDYFDVKIDNINRPDKLLVTRDISKSQAMFVHQVMTVIGVLAGLVVAWFTRSWTLLLTFIFIPGLLWFYSSSYKRQFIVGNLIVSFSAALVPLVVAIANAGYMRHRFGEIMQYTSVGKEIYLWIGVFSVFAFLTTLIREILKDLQDQYGDRELECHTLPILIGNTWTKVIVTILILLTAGLATWFVLIFNQSIVSSTPSFWSAPVRYLLFGLIVPLCCELYLIWSAKIPSDYKSAQLLMKFIMLIGVLFSIVIRFTI